MSFTVPPGEEENTTADAMYVLYESTLKSSIEVLLKAIHAFPTFELEVIVCLPRSTVVKNSSTLL